MYQLVNPYIEGQLETTFDGSTPLKAATKCWSKLSSMFTNCVPYFAFTLQEGGKLHHFVVNEKVDKNNKVSFKLKEYNNVDEGKVNKFLSKVKQLQEGGKRRKKHSDDDSSSSDSDSHELNKLKYNHIKQRANNSKLIGTYTWYWSYYPTIYDLAVYDAFYIPTLTAPYMPYFYICCL